MTTTNGFFLEMSTFFRKMTTSNEVRDSILDVDDVQTSSNIYDDDDDGQSWSIITPYLDLFYSCHVFLYFFRTKLSIILVNLYLFFLSLFSFFSVYILLVEEMLFFHHFHFLK